MHTQTHKIKPRIPRNNPHFHTHWLKQAAVWLTAMATEATQTPTSLSQENPEDQDT